MCIYATCSAVLHSRLFSATQCNILFHCISHRRSRDRVLDRYTNLQRRKVCKEGATPWTSLKPQHVRSSPATDAAAPHWSEHDIKTAVKADTRTWPVRGKETGRSAVQADSKSDRTSHTTRPTSSDLMVGKGIGRHRDSEKLALDVYEEGQSADALDEVDEMPTQADDRSTAIVAATTSRKTHVTGSARFGTIHTAHVRHQKSTNGAGKSKQQPKKVVLF